MLFGTIIYIVYSTMSIITSSIMSFLFWKRRNSPGALTMSILMLSATEWAFSDMLSGISSGLAVKFFWDNMDYIGIVSIPVLWFIFSIQYTRQETFLKRKYYYTLSIVPIITLIMILTNSYHHLLFFNIRTEPLYNSNLSLIVYDFGIWFWIHTFYSYCLIIIGMIIIFRRLIVLHKVYQKQAIIMIAAVLIPFIGEFLFLLGLSPSQGLDTTTFNFSISGVLFFIGMFRYKILDLIPIAREAVIESMDDLVIVLDTQNRIIDLNSAGRNIFGNGYDNLIGLPVSKVLNNQKLQFEENPGKLKYTEEVTLKIDDKKNYYEMKVSPLFNKKNILVGSFIVLSDITDINAAMEELKDAKVIAESASKAKSDFLATMSHEIRTPINGIIGMAELLKSANLTIKEQQNLDALQYSADTLLHIINEILDFSKIEAGKMEIENIDFNLKKLISQVYQTFSSNSKLDVISFTYEIDDNVPEFILGDYQKLRQVLTNLLSNAFKFTKKGKIELKVHCINNNGSIVLLIFSVSDTGIGMAKDKIDSLFQSFHQLDSSTTRKYGGTGLGLSIVKNLIELMGGSIEAQSEEGKGSRFLFELPFKVIEGPASDTILDTINTPEIQKNLNILVAEDSRVNQLVITQFINKKRWKADVVQNGKEVIRKLESNTYDLILMDIQMPEMDGYEATKSIRKREKTTGEHIPIIALTANATEHDKDMCLKNGMDGFISKPIKSEKLYSCILKYAK